MEKLDAKEKELEDRITETLKRAAIFRREEALKKIRVKELEKKK